MATKVKCISLLVACASVLLSYPVRSHYTCEALRLVFEPELWARPLIAFYLLVRLGNLCGRLSDHLSHANRDNEHPQQD
jgi:hypothetical protein